MLKLILKTKAWVERKDLSTSFFKPSFFYYNNHIYNKNNFDASCLYKIIKQVFIYF